PAHSTSKEQEQRLQQAQAKQPEKEYSLVHISFGEDLLNPELWLAAVGQIFFSLSIGTGTILTYASYVKQKEDIALSSLTANAANEVVEVGISGLMTVPAAVCFLGVSAAAGISTFGLGFEVLPQVFATMPGGQVFGLLFFGLLCLAAVTSSISQIQPSVSFLEEYWKLSRKQSLTLISLLILVGSFLVMWFTGDGLIALDTLDFFFSTLLLYLSSLSLLIFYNFAWNHQESEAELKRGALITPPRIAFFLMKWVTPTILIITFVAWLYQTIFIAPCQPILNVLEGKIGAIAPIAWVGIVTLLFITIIRRSARQEKAKQQSADD
ncbi:MAG: hypothetical protein R3Y56_11275, partial [Akkermansia sp.]